MNNRYVMLLSGGGGSRLSCGNKTDTCNVGQVQAEAFTHESRVSAGFASLVSTFHTDDDDDLSAPTLFISFF